MSRYCVLAYVLALGTLAAAPAIAAAEAETETVRPPAVSGTFYPSDPDELAQTVDRLLEEAPPLSVAGRLVGLIVPHAGYRYSGEVAATAFRLLQGRSYERVILIGPSHHHRFSGFALLHRGAMQTPLGAVPIDEETAIALVTDGNGFHVDWAVHAPEHALEVELPFLQRTLGAFRVVPVLAGDIDPTDATSLAAALRPLLDKETLLVVSVDLSHYHAYEEAVALDRRGLDAVAARDPEQFVGLLRSGSTEVDAPVPLLASIRLAEQLGASIRELAYKNSGDVTGDRRRVVGYAAMAIVVPEGTGEPSEPLTPEARRALLELARRTIEASVRRQPLPAVPTAVPEIAQPRGAFVTIERDHRLRGCIGYTQPVGSLAETVQQAAVGAALHDPRFKPVEPSELDHLDLEISVLSPPLPVTDPSRIQVGTHGLIIRKGRLSGLLLPQVATEYGWDRRTFLEETCRKAGLPPTAWQDPDVKIYLFTAEVFTE